MLARYSKPWKAGDQNSGGRGKLLRATTPLSRNEILVRETIQNAWDARKTGVAPTFGLRIYEIDPSVRVLLQKCVFTDLSSSLKTLADSLTSPGIRAIEIYDRGTTGLDGPVRVSEQSRPGEPNSFVSFVFDIGTTRESEVTGGTYGFGKTAAFEASSSYSVVYWSRCRTDKNELEHRLIALSLGDSYSEQGRRYTGAHWWGQLDSRDDVLPLRGNEAKNLGEAIFRTRFEDEETGTSILIIDPVCSQMAENGGTGGSPVRSPQDEEELTSEVLKALAHSAWPKMVPCREGQTPMKFEIFRNRTPIDLTPWVINEYSSFAYSLTKVRECQEQQEKLTVPEPEQLVRENIFPIRLRPGRQFPSVPHNEFFGDRMDKVAGHLHVVESVKDPLLDSNDSPSNSLCLMRSGAELVLRYDHLDSLENDYLQWHAVFKPTPQCDRHFASAEPPTHDRWTPEAATSEISKYVVGRSLDNVRSALRKFLSEKTAEKKQGERSVRGISTALGMFVPFGEVTEEVSAPRAKRSSRGVSSRNKDEFYVETIRTEAFPDGRGQTLDVVARTTGDADRMQLSIEPYARVSDGRMLLDSNELAVTWLSEGIVLSSDLKCVVERDADLQLVLKTRVATTLELEIRAERNNESNSPVSLSAPRSG